MFEPLQLPVASNQNGYWFALIAARRRKLGKGSYTCAHVRRSSVRYTPDSFCGAALGGLQVAALLSSRPQHLISVSTKV